MNKLLKKVLLFFILLCVIVIIVFAVELFVINRDKEPEEPISTDTSAPNNSSSPPAAASGTDSPGGTAEPSSGEGETDVSSLDKLYELPVPGGATLLLKADETLFEHQILDMLGDMFIYKGSGEPSALEISFIEGQEGLMLAPGFLDNYIDYSGGEYLSELDRKIGGSDITGVYVFAKNSTETYEAWLTDIEGGVLAFVINYRDDIQRDALYKVLDTFVMVSA